MFLQTLMDFLSEPAAYDHTLTNEFMSKLHDTMEYWWDKYGDLVAIEFTGLEEND